MHIKKFHEESNINGKKIVRKVFIKNAKGYKSVSHFKHGKHNGTVKKQICSDHIKLIKKGKFIPGLFNDCNIKNATRGKGSRKGRK